MSKWDLRGSWVIQVDSKESKRVIGCLQRLERDNRVLFEMK